MSFSLPFILKYGVAMCSAACGDLFEMYTAAKNISLHRFGWKLPSLGRHLAMVVIVRPVFSETPACCGIAVAANFKAMPELLQNP